MAKRAIFVVAGTLALCLSLSAQEAPRVEQQMGGALNRSRLCLPSLALLDQQRFSYSASFAWMQTTADFLPAFDPVEPRRTAFSPVRGRTKLTDENSEIRPIDRIYTGGEIGLLYGHSSGKYGGDYGRGYIIGEVGDDRFHITVGASHEEWNGRGPRVRR